MIGSSRDSLPRRVLRRTTGACPGQPAQLDQTHEVAVAGVADPGLVALFERSGRTHHGRALETAILLELERRGFEVAYVRKPEGYEVDFLAHRADDAPLLIHVAPRQGGRVGRQRFGELQAQEVVGYCHL